MVLINQCGSNGIAAHLNRIYCKGFKKCCISIAKDGNDGGMLWNGTKEDGKVRR